MHFLPHTQTFENSWFIYKPFIYEILIMNNTTFHTGTKGTTWHWAIAKAVVNVSATCSVRCIMLWGRIGV